METSIQLPLKKSEKEILIQASQFEKMPHTTFVRRVALLEAEKILKINREAESQ